MRRKYLVIYILPLIIFFLVIWFIPFTYNSGNYEYCKYRLSVYEFYRIESEGEGYDSSDSDTYIGSIIFEKKIGGPLEYFGLKEIKKPDDANNK